MAKKMNRILAGASGLMMAAGAMTAVAENVETGYAITQNEEKTYDAVENVAGAFRFEQNVMSPSDNVFSLFGTAATAACAAPSFAFENTEEKLVNYYLNVGGKMERSFQLTMKQLMENGKDDILKCSCAMSPSIVNVQVTGMPLENVVQMADLEDDVNAVIVKGSDGYSVSMSLAKAIEKNAMLVYKVGGEGLKPENGGPVQLWMPGAAANYFTRQVTDIEFIHADEVAEAKAPEAVQRAKISVMNDFAGEAFPAGSQITFEGYADDYDVPVAAVEFSMDGGKTWTAYGTPETSTTKWVYWYFTYDAQTPGSYKLDVRCRTADGKVSPLASSVEFTVK
jgi:DMSO/TMAO reductase YedYZ molybdopterin-dependent catalytic subunit